MEKRIQLLSLLICVSQGLFAATDFVHAEDQTRSDVILERGSSAGQMHVMIGFGQDRTEVQDKVLILNLQRMTTHHTSIRTLFYSEWMSNSVGYSQTGFGLGAAYHLMPQRAVNLSLFAEAGIAFADLISTKPDAAFETGLGIALDYHWNSFNFIQIQWRRVDTRLNGRDLGVRRHRDLISLSWGALF
ncbi:MAG TPA: hypothetical protein DCZ03_06075 [Gammaproteobacteria bacterium]|nr:hypothetical protein [Gammaproteobacteria bacterium]